MIKNSYYYFSEVLDDKFCDDVITLGLSKINELKERGESAAAVTAGDSQRGGINAGEMSIEDKTVEEVKQINSLDNTYIRDSEVAWLNEKWIYEKIIPFVDKANYEAGWKYDIDFFESFQFTKYGINQFYGWHMDGQTDHYGKYKRFIPGLTPLQNGKVPNNYTKNSKMVNKVRKISVTINISPPESYDGGLLKFDFGPHSTGERYHLCEEIKPRGSIIVFPSFVYHQVTPVTRGTRYSLVLWCLGKPFK